jgi:hypothetical protein
LLTVTPRYATLTTRTPTNAMNTRLTAGGGPFLTPTRTSMYDGQRTDSSNTEP